MALQRPTASPRWRPALAALLLLSSAAPSQSDFRLVEPTAGLYYEHALVAGERIQVVGATRIQGNVHSNGSVDLQPGSSVTGAVSAVGTVAVHGTVDGTVREGAAAIALPALPSDSELRQLADRVLEGDQTLTNAVLDDVVYVRGNVQIVGTLSGVGTLIAAGGIRLEALPENSPASPDPASRLSLIALEDIRLDQNRAFRGALYARRDVVLQKSLPFEGVAVAGRNLTIDKEARIQFVDFDTTAPILSLISPPADALLADAKPSLEVSWSDDLSGLDLATARFQLDGTDRTSEAQVNAIGLRFTPAGPLAEGRHTFEVSVADHSDNLGTASFAFTVDTAPPVLAFTAPLDTVTGDPTPEIALSYSDATSGADPASLQVVLDGTPLAGCAAGAASATCEPPALAAGSHTVTASLRDLAGNTATASRQFTLVLNVDPPVVVIARPTPGELFTANPVEVAGTVTSQSAIASVRVNGQPVALAGGAFSATVTLPNGPGSIRVEATDANGKTGMAAIAVEMALDTAPPEVSIAQPAEGGFVLEERPTLVIRFQDDSAVDPESLALVLNGTPLAASCEKSTGEARCIPSAALPEGPATLEASVLDSFGNRGTASVRFVVDTGELAVAFTAPEPGLITKDLAVTVQGTVSAGVERVEVNGFPASLSGATFTAEVPLRQGNNMIVALATKSNGRTGTSSIPVTQDLVAPIVRIDSPRDGFVSLNDRIALTGLANDAVTGGVEPQVLVNGVEARMGVGSFLVEELALVRGPNTIEAVATDQVGNTGRHSITVVYQPAAGARITMRDGNGQAAFVKMPLAQPLVAVLQDEVGNPLAGRVVRFQVTRNNGLLRGKPGDEPARTVQVVSDGAGRAAVLYTLGDTSGEGMNRVVATAVGAAGEVEFSATGLPQPAERILMTAGDNQRGAAGSPLLLPLEALVIDQNGNPIPGVAVTFQVVQGAGHFDGGSEIVKTTSIDGHVRAVLTLGLQPGVNIASATFAGQTCLPATFTATGLVPGAPEETRMSGVVLDNAHTPIPGARVSIWDHHTFTDENGQFVLTGVPAGQVHLVIDPKNSPRPETFPPLAFEAITVAGQNNTIGQPILIPALDTATSKIVGGSEDVTVQMEGVEGLELTVFANSAKFPDGNKVGRISISQVHLDKVPMAPPDGTFFMPPAWTIQPHGVHFDPPARISIPNNGLLPGRMVDIYQFDHSLYQFVNVGKGTVTEDGLKIVSDPGFGISSAGWGGPSTPPPPQTCASGCGQCAKCQNSSCVPNAASSCDDRKFCTSATGHEPGPDKCENGSCRGRRVADEDLAEEGTEFPVEEYRDALRRVAQMISRIPRCEMEPPTISVDFSTGGVKSCCEQQKKMINGSKLSGGGSLSVQAECNIFGFDIPDVAEAQIQGSISLSGAIRGSGTIMDCQGECKWAVTGQIGVTPSLGVEVELPLGVLEANLNAQFGGSIKLTAKCGAPQLSGCVGPLTVVGSIEFLELFTKSVHVPIPGTEFCN